ncbi:MAG TPA: sulfur carrier protein ThiS [bacterium]|nr:sulfur carrier protein ThiS [bacterium]
MEKAITVNGNVIEWFEGMTVTDVLSVMKYTFKLLVVHVNDDIIKRDEWPLTIIPQGAEVKVIHLMSGG